MDALSANMQFVCKQVPSIIDYMQTSGVVVGKTVAHNVKKDAD